jgi:cytochrome P450
MHQTRGLHEFPSLQSVLPDPYPLLTAYRQLGDVVYSPVEKAWVVTSHAAVIELLRATSEFSNHSNGIERILQGADGLKHLNTRRAVNNGFSPAILERIEPDLREVARTCILNARSRGSVESIAQLAQPMPTRVFSELTGATEVAGQRLLQWGGAISSHGRLISPSERLSVNAKRMMARAVRRVSDPTYPEFLEAKELIVSLLRDAGSGGSSTPMINSLRELVDSKAVQLEDAIGVGLEFVFASTETTMGLIGFMLKRLCEDPQLLGHLKSRGEIRDTFIEEVLRHDAPVMKLNRRVKQSTSLCGQELATGDLVVAVIAAANRDPRVFDRADEFEVDRSPNRHLAFGMGPHACPGARLARLEARVFLDEFLNLVDRVTIDPVRTAVTYRGLGVTRSIAEMHIVLS